MSRAVPAIAFLLLGCGVVPATSESPPPTRRPVGQVLPAAVGPIRELHFAKEFRYVGGQRFILRKTADAEQHFFVVPGKPGAVRRLYWVQFEKLLPGIGESYDYSPDEAVTVGGVLFRRNVRHWDAPPEPDSDRGAMPSSRNGGIKYRTARCESASSTCRTPIVARS